MIVKDKRGSKMNHKRRFDDHCLRRALARLPSASSAARRRLWLLAMLLLRWLEKEDLRLTNI
jgi:hypothetical protein